MTQLSYIIVVGSAIIGLFIGLSLFDGLTPVLFVLVVSIVVGAIIAALIENP